MSSMTSSTPETPAPAQLLTPVPTLNLLNTEIEADGASCCGGSNCC